MNAGFTATGRPRQGVPLVRQLGALALAVGLTLEGSRYLAQDKLFARMPLFGPGVGEFAAWYEPRRAWVLAHLALLAAGAVLALVALLALYRWWLLIWHNEVVARLSGTRFRPADLRFPMRPVDLLAEVARRPPGTSFVGLTPTRGWLGWKWRPTYLSQQQKTMHRHVLGKTGSGKTLSVLWPSVLQATR